MTSKGSEALGVDQEGSTAGSRATTSDPEAPRPGFFYKGYTGRVRLLSFPAPSVWFGEVVGIRDVVTFEAQTLIGLRRAFRDSVNDYLAMCAERGEEPHHPSAKEEMLKANLHRLLNVVKGDWSDYALPHRFTTYAPSGQAGGVSVGTLDVVEYDWELLRHDIHVIYHVAVNAQRTQNPGQWFLLLIFLGPPLKVLLLFLFSDTVNGC